MRHIILSVMLMVLTVSAQAAKPNILIFIADDFGYGDPSFNGGQISTPSLDKLAKSAIVLRDFHTSPVCTPSRLGLATGRYPQRLPEFNTANNSSELPRSEITLAKSLRKYGYATGLVGKSHIGRTNPLDYGFQYFHGFLSGACDYKAKLENCGWRHNRQSISAGTEYSTSIFTREARNFISRNTDRPWFLQVSWQAAHTPIQAPTDDPGHHDPSHYKQVVQAMDYGIGRILDRLDSEGLTQNTIVVFIGDNGGEEIPTPSGNKPLGGGKGDVFEGGHRVPAIVRWPGRTKAGSTTNQTLAVIDLMPTLLRAVGAPFPTRPFDGVNISTALTGGSIPARDLFWWNFWGSGPRAVRRGPWKLIVRDGTTQLFNLSSDIGETRNRASENARLVSQMRSALDAWRNKVLP